MRGCCRWGTTDKLRQIDKYCESEPTIVYVGIASDEHKRIIKERKPYKRFPLVEWNMTERDCLKYCYENGWNWKEQSSNVPLGYIDLYDILDRVSCWCCSNKNKKELINIYKYLPQYWQKLKDFQSRTDRPMKKFVKEGKSYGNINEMEKVFEEIIQKKY